jgi:ketosteroid isomerase-like protein
MTGTKTDLETYLGWGDRMSTKETLQKYFRELQQRKGWKSFLAEDMTFTSFVNPIKHVSGKVPYIESTRRFFSMIASADVRDMIIEGEKACVLTRYELQPPNGGSFASDVAEVFTVRNGKIASLAIYFDATPFPK